MCVCVCVCVCVCYVNVNIEGLQSIRLPLCKRERVGMRVGKNEGGLHELGMMCKRDRGERCIFVCCTHTYVCVRVCVCVCVMCVYACCVCVCVSVCVCVCVCVITYKILSCT